MTSATIARACTVRAPTPGVSNKSGKSFARPVKGPRLLAPAVHALLHDSPLAVVSDDEAVQVEIETILHTRAVDLRNQAARLGKSGSVDADTVADGDQFLRRVS